MDTGSGIIQHNKVVPYLKKNEFFSDTLSYTVDTRQWCRVIMINVHPPTEDKQDVLKKKSFIWKCKSEYFSEYDMQIVPVGFSAENSGGTFFYLI